jgi:L-2-amino-thiazoline-4-carboxylic acid hydrolase
MKKQKAKVPDKYLPYIKRGYASSGLLFLAMLEELGERFSEEETMEFAKRVMRRTGTLSGKLMAKKMPRNDMVGFAEGYAKAFPNLDIVEYSEEKFIVRCDFCGAYEIWKDLGLSDEKISELAEIYCSRDVAFARAFNPRINLEYGERIMKGDKVCEWRHTFTSRS